MREERWWGVASTVSALVLAIAITLASGVVSPAPATAQEAEPSLPADSLVVVTTELAPFVTLDGDLPDGFYLEIWEDVAARLGVSYELVWVESFPAMLAEVEAGRADVAVAPLAPTAAREPRFDFTSAVVSSGPQLGVHDRNRSEVSVLRTLVGSGALRVLLVAVVGLVLLGHVIWLVERNDDDGFSDFHSSYPRGVLDGIWWAAVTVTTVGYGDTAPRSLRGRLVAMLAMLASLFLVGAFVSEVTADLSERRAELSIESIGDLDGRAVGVVEGSSFADHLVGRGVDTAGYATQDDVFLAASSGEVDVVVANPYALATIGPDHDVIAVGDVLYEEFETFGLQQGSPWREPINAVLADLQASGRVQTIVDRWVD